MYTLRAGEPSAGLLLYADQFQLFVRYLFFDRILKNTINLSGMSDEKQVNYSLLKNPCCDIVKMTKMTIITTKPSVQ